MAGNSSEWMKYSGLGIQMTATMMVFWWLGKQTEIYLGMPIPWGQMSGLFFGLFAAIYNLIKSINN